MFFDYFNMYYFIDKKIYSFLYYVKIFLIDFFYIYFV